VSKVMVKKIRKKKAYRPRLKPRQPVKVYKRMGKRIYLGPHGSRTRWKDEASITTTTTTTTTTHTTTTIEGDYVVHNGVDVARNGDKVIHTI